MSKKIVVISAVWCPSCLILNKQLKQIKENYKDLEIIKLDYDFDEELVEKYNVGKKLPVIILEDDNQEIRRLTGEKEYSEITSFIEGDLV